MPKFDTPLQLAPVFKPKIWGRRDLSPLYGEPPITASESGRSGLAPDAPIGEAWLTDDEARDAVESFIKKHSRKKAKDKATA